MSDLADAVAAAVGSLGTAHIQTLVDAYRDCDRPFSTAAAAAIRHSLPAVHRRVVDRLNTAWQAEADLPGGAIAVALDAVRSATRAADVPTVEIVVTGPTSPAAPVRLTSEVVCQMIGRSTERVTLVSYAAYQVTAVNAALDAAVARGVAVSLILESADKLDGGGGAHAYAAFDMFRWPADRREPPEANCTPRRSSSTATRSC